MPRRFQGRQAMYHQLKPASLAGMARTLTMTAMLFPLSLAACSGGGDDSNGRVDTSGTPECADVWVVGHRLPTGYEGCVRPDGDLVAAVSTSCHDGSLLMVYGETLYALVGGEVKQSTGPQDDAYRATYWGICLRGGQHRP